MAVTYESSDGVAIITIDRADKRNAINRQVCQGLSGAWQRFARDDDKVAILAAAGDQAFCAGADLKDFPGEIWQAVPNLGVPCDKPIIAAIGGYAVGAGCSLALYSDMVIASETATFIYSEGSIGVFQGLMGGFPRKMPYGVGLEWTLTGEPMTARRAYEIGFVNKVCTPGQQLDVALDLARTIASKAPLVVQELKSMALKTLPASPMDVFYPQKHRLDTIANSDDAEEGRSAFAEKRPPNFKGA
ncbi:MAG: crotonase [Erythrobacter sp.]|nr:crotonase [Erythrobacter sp.]